MLHLVVIAALAAAPDAPSDAPKQEPVKLASPGFNAVNVDDKLAGFFADHFAQQLSLQGLRVLTASEISALVGFERQKQLLGCSDNSQSCMAELANALGVDGLIIGSLAKFDTTYQVNLKVVSASDAAPLAVFSGQAEGDKGMLAKLNEAAKAIGPAVLKKMGRAPVAVASEATGAPNTVDAAGAGATSNEVSATASSGGGKKWPLVPTIVGGVGIAGGAFMLFLASDERDSMMKETNIAGARSRASVVVGKSIASSALFAVGAAGLVTAGVMYATSGSAPATTAAIVPTGDGAALAVSGSLP